MFVPFKKMFLMLLIRPQIFACKHIPCSHTDTLWHQKNCHSIFEKSGRKRRQRCQPWIQPPRGWLCLRAGVGPGWLSGFWSGINPKSKDLAGLPLLIRSWWHISAIIGCQHTCIVNLGCPKPGRWCPNRARYWCGGRFALANAFDVWLHAANNVTKSAQSPVV